MSSSELTPTVIAHLKEMFDVITSSINRNGDYHDTYMLSTVVNTEPLVANAQDYLDAISNIPFQCKKVLNIIVDNIDGAGYIFTNSVFSTCASSSSRLEVVALIRKALVELEEQDNPKEQPITIAGDPIILPDNGDLLDVSQKLAYTTGLLELSRETVAALKAELINTKHDLLAEREKCKEDGDHMPIITAVKEIKLVIDKGEYFSPDDCDSERDIWSRMEAALLRYEVTCENPDDADYYSMYLRAKADMRSLSAEVSQSSNINDDLRRRIENLSASLKIAKLETHRAPSDI
tara:strand:- start:9238 stop:10113 length:876 start_codon:yes stop_codon:yes gene_type:complete